MSCLDEEGEECDARACLLYPGDIVTGEYFDHKYYLATVVLENADGTYWLKWADTGEIHLWSHHRHELRFVQGAARDTPWRGVSSPPLAPASDGLLCLNDGKTADSEFFAGDVVWARWRDRRWYMAQLVQDTGNGSFLIDWLDNSFFERVVPTKHLRHLPFYRVDDGVRFYVSKERMRCGKPDRISLCSSEASSVPSEVAELALASESSVCESLWSASEAPKGQEEESPRPHTARPQLSSDISVLEESSQEEGANSGLTEVGCPEEEEEEPRFAEEFAAERREQREEEEGEGEAAEERVEAEARSRAEAANCAAKEVEEELAISEKISAKEVDEELAISERISAKEAPRLPPCSSGSLFAKVGCQPDVPIAPRARGEPLPEPLPEPSVGVAPEEVLAPPPPSDPVVGQRPFGAAECKADANPEAMLAARLLERSRPRGLWNWWLPTPADRGPERAGASEWAAASASLAAAAGLPEERPAAEGVSAERRGSGEIAREAAPALLATQVFAMWENEPTTEEEPEEHCQHLLLGEGEPTTEEEMGQTPRWRQRASRASSSRGARASGASQMDEEPDLEHMFNFEPEPGFHSGSAPSRGSVWGNFGPGYSWPALGEVMGFGKRRQP